MKRTVLILGTSFSIMVMGFVSLAFAENTQNIKSIRSHFITLPNLICIDTNGQARYCVSYTPFVQPPKVTLAFK